MPGARRKRRRPNASSAILTAVPPPSGTISLFLLPRIFRGYSKNTSASRRMSTGKSMPDLHDRQVKEINASPSFFMLFYPRLPLWGRWLSAARPEGGAVSQLPPYRPFGALPPPGGGSRSLIRCFAPPSPRTGKVSGDLFFVRRASKKERREHRSRRSFIRINNSLPGPRNSSAGGCRPGRHPAPSCPRPGDRSCGTPRP